MRAWWQRFVNRADIYYDRDWRIVMFQPVLYLFVFGAAVRLAVETSFEPVNLSKILPASYSYGLWLVLGMAGPLMALHAWWFIRKGGRMRIMGMWLRLSGDLAMFTALLTYHLAVVLSNPPTESRVFSRYIIGAVMLFVMELIIRDMWAIRLIERRIHWVDRRGRNAQP